MTTPGRTSLSPRDYETAAAGARRVIERDGRVTNRSLRDETGLNYDQAIKFFGLATGTGLLRRMGRASGVHYLLAVTEEAT